ncbi:MAG TPA: GMC family oxidoreductase N-terminal domain-containing protein [Jiangellaceae bacterium]
MASEEYDYVVVGGGTAGAAVAARLSEDPGVTVALVEAGPSDAANDTILQLNKWMTLLESGSDWDYLVEPQASGNSFLRHSRGRVLGGCSSHSSGIAFWAPAEDLNDWAIDFGCAGWDAKRTERLFQRIETNSEPGEHHGADGPVPIRQLAPEDPCGVAVLNACEHAGIPRTQFNDGTTVVSGANFVQINCLEDGVRASSSVSYLHPIIDTRPNLTVLCGLRAKSLLFDGAQRCVGVDVLDADVIHTRRILAAREVVLSAGAIESPKLLMLSGIGPADHLMSVGIPVRLHSPGVGSNLQDHPEAVVQWVAKRPMVTESPQWREVVIFAATDDGLDRPDIMLRYSSVPLDAHTVRYGFPTTENGFTLAPSVTRPRSRGTVRLRSIDFRDKPRVDPRYFTDPYDLRVITQGIRLARHIASKRAMSDWAGDELAPGLAVQTDDDIAEYIQRTHGTAYHLAGSVRMGSPDDDMAPLDPELRVKGVSGLRVADASIMPELVTVDPEITTMMIGEKCADLINSS